MTLPNGKYRTKAGSTLEITGHYPRVGALARNLQFDYNEESPACVECLVNHSALQAHDGNWFLTWECTEHESGSAQLFPVEDK